MVQNAAYFLKNWTEKEIHKTENNNYLLLLKHYFRWKGVADKVCFVKY